MRRWGVQFRVRRLMAVVAVTAVVLAVGPLRQRTASYHRKALEHAYWVEANKENAKVQLKVGRERPEIRRLMEASAAEWEQVAAWHADLAEKYAHAAARPWETMPNDPPPPLSSVPLSKRFSRAAAALRHIERGP